MIDPHSIFSDPRVAELADAIMDGRLADVERMIASGTDVKAVGAKGFTLPHFALHAKSQGAQILRVILKAGADPISRLENGSDVPHYAAARDRADPAFMEVLLDAGVSPDLIGGERKSSLLAAAVSGRNLPIVKLLISRGADLNYNSPFSGTALHTAASIADYAIAATLLDAGIDPSLRNNQHPSIAPNVPRLTAAEVYCRFQSGVRIPPTPEQAAAFEKMKQAFARRGVVLPCGI